MQHRSPVRLAVLSTFALVMGGLLAGCPSAPRRAQPRWEGLRFEYVNVEGGDQVGETVRIRWDYNDEEAQLAQQRIEFYTFHAFGKVGSTPANLPIAQREYCFTLQGPLTVRLEAVGTLSGETSVTFDLTPESTHHVRADVVVTDPRYPRLGFPSSVVEGWRLGPRPLSRGIVFPYFAAFYDEDRDGRIDGLQRFGGGPIAGTEYGLPFRGRSPSERENLSFGFEQGFRFPQFGADAIPKLLETGDYLYGEETPVATAILFAGALVYDGNPYTVSKADGTAFRGRVNAGRIEAVCLTVEFMEGVMFGANVHHIGEIRLGNLEQGLLCSVFDDTVDEAAQRSTGEPGDDDTPWRTPALSPGDAGEIRGVLNGVRVGHGVITTNGQELTADLDGQMINATIIDAEKLSWRLPFTPDTAAYLFSTSALESTDETDCE